MHSCQKLIESMFERRTSPILKQRIPEWQRGGIKGREAAELAFVLNRYLRMRKKIGSDTYCLFLDAVKAYDVIDREVLYTCLRKFGFQEDAIQWVKSFHQGCTNSTKVNSIKIETFL